jgi:ubiquitin C-terminal hydrolase
MIPLDVDLLPAPFGLHNPAANCYLNSLLQALATCTSLTRTVVACRGYLARTRTGAAVYNYVAAITNHDPGVAEASSRVLAAVVADLAARCPGVRFGHSQECAYEALAHILEMSTVPDTCNPLAELFAVRYRGRFVCPAGHATASVDEGYSADMFHLRGGETTAETFAAAMMGNASAVTDYACEKCGHKTTATATYTMTMASEILYCVFDRVTGRPASVWFPATLALGRLRYGLVAQIEHSGSPSGGHYWARALRAGGGGVDVRVLNDTAVSAGRLEPTAATYAVVYHLLSENTNHQTGTQ